MKLLTHRYTTKIQLLFALGLASIMGGCGGGSTPEQASPTKATGRLVLAFVFPHAALTRQGAFYPAIPPCTMAVKVEVQEPNPSVDTGVAAGTELVQPQIVAPPMSSGSATGTATVTFNKLRVGKVHVVVTAYANKAATSGNEIGSGVSAPDPVIVPDNNPDGSPNPNSPVTTYIPISSAPTACGT